MRQLPPHTAGSGGRRLIGVAVTLFLLLAMALQTSASHAADTPVNLARNAGAHAVASYQDGSYTAANAIDGNTGTRWSSDHSNDTGAWIYVDLGGEYTVSSAALTWEAAYASAYKVQVSDDSTHWTDAYSTTGGHGGTETVAVNRNAHYVRMQGVTPATQYGYSLWEFAVYGTATGGGSGAAGSPTVAPSTTYPTTYSDWQDGLLAGNGKQGIIVFGNPRNDTVVFDDKDFFMARTEAHPHRTFNTVSQNDINTIRDELIAGQYQQANQLAADVQGYQGGGEGSKHPGYKMTIAMPDAGTVGNYVRSTDYSAGVVKVNWSDDKGAWERDSFVSRADGATVQYQAAPPGQKETMTLGLSIDPGMNLTSKGVTSTTNNSTDYLNLRAKYPSGSYNAGYEGVTRIVTDGTKTLSNGNVTVSNASYVLLLSLTQRYNGTYNGGVPAEQEWSRNLLQQKLAGMSTDYATLLNRHTSAHSSAFGRVSVDFGATPADRAKSTEQLLAEQKSSSTPVPALYERMFYAGRYHLLGSSGPTQAPDLLGNWTGDSNVGWDGYYHLDANLNLQISSGNIGNMPEAMQGYFWLNQQWQKDFETNASKLLGTRGMLTGGNTPNGEGLISNINFDYPYQYVTGGESWLLEPFWEYYEVTGDTNFLATKYYPLIRDMGDFYEDFLKKKDANGNYVFAGSISPENTPPGGVPLAVNSVYDISGAKFALTTLIQTAKLLGRDADKIPVWQEKLDHLPPYLVNNDGALAEWAWPDLENKNNYQHRHSSGLMPVWPYREITPESNAAQFKAAQVFLQKKDQGSYENAGHGLLHGALLAADLDMPDSVGAKLLRFAKDDYYYSSMATSHYNGHNTFATDVVNSVPTVMMEMLAATKPGTLELLPGLPKGLTKGSISGMLGKSQFTIDNLAWDTGAHTAKVTLTSKIDQNLTLIQRSGISSITGDGVSVQNSPLGNIARVLPLQAGKTVTVNLTMSAPKANLALGRPATASSQSSADQSAAKAFDGDLSSRWSANQDPAGWIQVDLGSTQNLSEVDLLWEASYAKSYRLQASTDGSTWRDIYTQPDSPGGTEKIPVSGQARYVRMQGSQLSGQWGYSLYEMQVFG
ncbi:glycosyl hydrolase family 95 catalytic domain-containing protein [Actinacidiphila bryophytorum]|uniref:glycosyl hydrolase family 95 catalytic domain-containing protein n=1 Tax=Actinacidiphila bryophytorum TaxID=1436133 RepID=UPI002176E6FD|nr:discoidin domain-containing protein [Actinacidiphila bryophytorum]UWE10877.1 discoidin domain-containing protein [Actinacidiphila bryophytorum]